MGLFNTIARVFTAKAASTAEKIEDSNALELAAQDIRELEKELETSKSNYAQIEASLMKIGRDLAALNAEFESGKTKAKQLKEIGNIDLAQQMANRCLKIKEEVATLEEHKAMFEKNKQQQQDNIDDLTDGIEEAKRDLATMKAQDMVTKSTEAIVKTNTDGIGSVKSRLDRFKEKQQGRLDAAQARLTAEKTSQSLDDRVEAALGATKESKADDFLSTL
jgi:phage shock protein A